MRGTIAKLATEPNSIDLVEGHQQGVWSLFEHTLAVSWIFEIHDPEARDRVRGDIDRIKGFVQSDGSAKPDDATQPADCYVHEGRIMGGQTAADGWTVLLATALRRRQEKTEAL